MSTAHIKLSESAGLLVNAIRERQPEQALLMLYFDEINTLTEIDLPSDGLSAYDVLSKVIDHLSPLPIITVILSTMSRLAAFSPIKRYHHSMRIVASHEDGRLAAFTGLPFDVLVCEEPICEGQYTLNEACRTSFLVRFGRPLFVIFVQSSTLL